MQKHRIEQRDGLNGVCQVCGPVRLKAERTRSGYVRYRCYKKVQEIGRRADPHARWIKYQYGLTPIDYARMLGSQSGMCAVCGDTPASSRLYVDHDHATGAIRQLLCHHCNLAVAHVRENPNTARAVAAYLERHGK